MHKYAGREEKRIKTGYGDEDENSVISNPGGGLLLGQDEADVGLPVPVWADPWATDVAPGQLSDGLDGVSTERWTLEEAERWQCRQLGV